MNEYERSCNRNWMKIKCERSILLYVNDQSSILANPGFYLVYTGNKMKVYNGFHQWTYMSNWISSGMGKGTGGIPTADNLPETND
jgi:hypothetical protein